METRPAFRFAAVFAAQLENLHTVFQNLSMVLEQSDQLEHSIVVIAAALEKCFKYSVLRGHFFLLCGYQVDIPVEVVSNHLMEEQKSDFVPLPSMTDLIRQH